MAFSSMSFDDGGDEQDMSRLFGPGHVDQVIRQAIQACWMGLPKEKRNVQEVESQIRRLVDRALANLREDHEAFGHDDDV